MPKISLRDYLETIVLSDLEDREKFENKINELNSIENNVCSYSSERHAYFGYALSYSNKFKELEDEAKRKKKPFETELYSNLLFFMKKTIIYSKKNLSTADPLSNNNSRLLHSIMGNLYFWFGKFIINGGRADNLDDILVKKDSETIDNRHLIMNVFEEAIKHFEISREFGNREKENDSKLGVAYVELASLSNKPIERYENLLKGIMNFELSRIHGNEHTANDECIATAYQDMGHLISNLDLFLNQDESRRFVEIKEKLYNQTEGYFDCFEILKDLNISENSKFNRSDVEKTAILFLEKALEGYNNVHEKKGKYISTKDYTYRGKCALRLGKLRHSFGHVKLAKKDLENALKLKKDRFVYSLLGETYYTSAHYYISFSSIEEKIKEFRRAAFCYVMSNRMGNTKQEIYGMIAESYRCLLKAEFGKKDPNKRLIEGYLKKSIKYAERAINGEIK